VEWAKPVVLGVEDQADRQDLQITSTNPRNLKKN
jgi:hypothetical protein